MSFSTGPPERELVCEKIVTQGGPPRGDRVKPGLLAADSFIVSDLIRAIHRENSVQIPEFIRGKTGFLFKNPCEMLLIFESQLIGNFSK